MEIRPGSGGLGAVSGLLSLGQERADLVVGGLIEVAIELADGEEVSGRVETDEVVHLGAEFGAGKGGGDRDGDNEAIRDGTEGADGGLHGGAGGEAVVDENDGAALERKRWAAGAVEGFSALDFKLLAGDDGVDGGLADVEGLHDVVVEDDDASAGERAHGQLFFAGDAEFADDEDVEGQAEGAGDLKGYGNTAAGQGEDDGVVQTG